MKKKIWFILIVIIVVVVLFFFFSKKDKEEENEDTNQHKSYSNAQLLTMAAYNTGKEKEEIMKEMQLTGVTPINTSSKLGVILAELHEINKAQSMASTFAKKVIGNHIDGVVGASLEPFTNLNDRILALTNYYVGEREINPYTAKYTSIAEGLRWQRDYTSAGKRYKATILSNLNTIGL